MRKITAIIPARGGSKGVPRKNIKPIAGFPLIYWTIQAAKNSALLHDFYLSTEDREIADIAKKFGAKVLIRPEHLSQDETTTIAVLQHIINEIDTEAVMVLQPTSPVRNKDTIDECIRDFCSGNYDTLATGYKVKIIEYGTHKNMRRQDIRGFFYDDGNIYIIDRNVIARGDWFGGTIYRKTLPRECNYEIDDETDFFICDSLLRKRLREGVQPWNIAFLSGKIKMLVMDVDGVLTDAGMYYSESGDEVKKFNTRDGKGIELLRNIGVKTAIITSENTKMVERRAKKLRIDHLIQGAKHKENMLRDIAAQEGFSLSEIAYIGDDVNDLEALKIAGLPLAPSNACDEVKAIALYTSHTPGGQGAVREICDLILSAKNRKPVN